MKVDCRLSMLMLFLFVPPKYSLSYLKEVAARSCRPDYRRKISWRLFSILAELAS